MRNGSWGVRGSLYPRWYLFSHTKGSDAKGRFGDGWLYLVHASGFSRESSSLGLFDTAQWASPAPVTPIARVPVAADDFPFRDRVLSDGEDERMASTMVRAMRSGR
jgi:hypothetical protein